jgi:hypothetical protein
LAVCGARSTTGWLEPVVDQVWDVIGWGLPPTRGLLPERWAIVITITVFNDPRGFLLHIHTSQLRRAPTRFTPIWAGHVRLRPPPMSLIPLRGAVIFAVTVIDKPRGFFLLFHARLS